MARKRTVKRKVKRTRKTMKRKHHSKRRVTKHRSRKGRRRTGGGGRNGKGFAFGKGLWRNPVVGTEEQVTHETLTQEVTVRMSVTLQGKLGASQLWNVTDISELINQSWFPGSNGDQDELLKQKWNNYHEKILTGIDFEIYNVRRWMEWVDFLPSRVEHGITTPAGTAVNITQVDKPWVLYALNNCDRLNAPNLTNWECMKPFNMGKTTERITIHVPFKKELMLPIGTRDYDVFRRDFGGNFTAFANSAYANKAFSLDGASAERTGQRQLGLMLLPDNQAAALLNMHQAATQPDLVVNDAIEIALRVRTKWTFRTIFLAAAAGATPNVFHLDCETRGEVAKGPTALYRVEHGELVLKKEEEEPCGD